MKKGNQFTVISYFLLVTGYWLLVTGSFPALATLRSSANYGIQSDVVNHGGTKSTSATYTLRQGSAGQLGAVGSSSSIGYIAGQGYIYNTNTKPATPETLLQYKADGTTAIIWPAGWTNTTNEVMKFNINDYDPGDILTPQIEVQLSGEAFTNSVSFEGSVVNYSGVTLTRTVGATAMTHARSYIWQARTKDLENYYSDWATLGGSPDYRVDLFPPGPPIAVLAYASPESTPTYVYLTWTPTTDASSGIAGYYLYSSNTPGSGYTKRLNWLIPTTATSDATVEVGTDYYYVLTSVNNASSEGLFSNQASAPMLNLTREAVVTSPAGYSGGAHDPVPGAFITYSIIYNNKGFAQANDVIIVDKIPTYTQYKINSATGEGVSAIQYSSNEGSTWNYVPTGDNVDGLVTNIKWFGASLTSGQNTTVSYGAVIR